MTCEEMEKKLPAWGDEVLSPREEARMTEHLQSCARCRASLAELEKTRTLLRRLPAVEPPPWLRQKIMARVREEAAHREGFFSRLFRPLSVKVPLSGLALALIAVLAFHVYQTGEREMKAVIDLSAPVAEQTVPPEQTGVPAQTAAAPPASPSTVETPPAPERQAPLTPEAAAPERHISGTAAHRTGQTGAMGSAFSEGERLRGGRSPRSMPPVPATETGRPYAVSPRDDETTTLPVQGPSLRGGRSVAVSPPGPSARKEQEAASPGTGDRAAQPQAARQESSAAPSPAAVTANGDTAALADGRPVREAKALRDAPAAAPTGQSATAAEALFSAVLTTEDPEEAIPAVDRLLVASGAGTVLRQQSGDGVRLTAAMPARNIPSFLRELGKIGIIRRTGDVPPPPEGTATVRITIAKTPGHVPAAATP